MTKVIKAEDLPEGEEVYLRKSYDGWRVVYPIKNNDGSYNWFNICTGGNYWRMIKPFIYLLIILAVIWAYNADVKSCRDALNNIDEICMTYNSAISIGRLINDTNNKLTQEINFSGLKLEKPDG